MMKLIFYFAGRSNILLDVLTALGHILEQHPCFDNLGVCRTMKLAI